jgi:hypothetical protein
MTVLITCANVECTETVSQDVYLIPAGSEEQITMLLNGGFSPDAFQIAFIGFLVIWATGLGIGLILNLIKKMVSKI